MNSTTIINSINNINCDLTALYCGQYICEQAAKVQHKSGELWDTHIYIYIYVEHGFGVAEEQKPSILAFSVSVFHSVHRVKYLCEEHIDHIIRESITTKYIIQNI